MSRTVYTILGCGSSGGVPRVGQGWGACDPSNPRNRRTRCAFLVERHGPNGVTRVLVDAGPDLRAQLLQAEVTHLDGIVITHDHADHTHGLDDLRPLALHQRRRLDVYADETTRKTLMTRFGYCFEAPVGSAYPPILTLHGITAGELFTITGAGGPVAIKPFRVWHGRDYMSLGMRFNNIIYCPDISRTIAEFEESFEGCEVLVIDALRDAPHPTHFTVADALKVVERYRPRKAILTNLHTDLDFDALSGRLPAHVEAAYDGLRFSVDHDK
ncbi:MAG: MBL fold metallo-hydrolase [Alphaproteobacteria bacterium]